jgi:hypothetical protein
MTGWDQSSGRRNGSSFYERRSKARLYSQLVCKTANRDFSEIRLRIFSGRSGTAAHVGSLLPRAHLIISIDRPLAFKSSVQDIQLSRWVGRDIHDHVSAALLRTSVFPRRFDYVSPRPGMAQSLQPPRPLRLSFGTQYKYICVPL